MINSSLTQNLCLKLLAISLPLGLSLDVTSLEETRQVV